MTNRPASSVHFSLSFILLASFLTLLWAAGGASRGDVLGQPLVRFGACLVFIISLLGGGRYELIGTRPILFFLTAVILIPVVHLLPLPPDLWEALPNRGQLLVSGQEAQWRPISVSPGATLNSLFSLIVPAAVFILCARLNSAENVKLLSLVAAFVMSAGILGLAQLSGARFNNPLINDVPGVASSIFANRNHFSLLVAVGCVIITTWSLIDERGVRWRIPIALASILLFVLTVLAIGSRSGVMLVAISLAICLSFLYKPIRRMGTKYPPWMLRLAIVFVFLAAFVLITASVFFDRVEAIDRIFAADVEGDLRLRAQPTIIEIIRSYFPWGAGMGSFDAVFRISEPNSLLSIQYFNQAHNDYLGILVDAGLIGGLLIASSLVWWAQATFKAFRASVTQRVILARLGSAMLLLIFVASATDYPARTPTIMAVIIIASIWLAQGSTGVRRSALPRPTSDV